MRARLRLLGEPILTAGPDPHASPIDLSSLHTQLLLAFLALHPTQPIDRHNLAFVLWPDVTEAVALRNLRQHLHRLRHIMAALGLPDDTLSSQGNWLRFNPDSSLWIDVHEFQRQVGDRRRQIEAIELYRGDLLKDHAADWINPLRTRLRERYMEALRDLIAVANMQRNYPRAVYYARRLLQADPFRESSHRITMEALYFNRERVQALQHFSQLKQLLKRELSTDPMPQTVALYRQIQTGTLPGDLPVLIGSSRQAPHALKTIAHISAAFIGRREELARLDEALAQALNGRGQFVLITGESGLGKTRLLHTWRQARAERLLSLCSQCEANATVPPGASILEALRQGYDQVEREWLPAAAPGVRALESWLQTPASTPFYPLASNDLPPAASLVEKLGHLILTLAARSKRVVGLLIDDLHDADAATWQLLGYLARRCAATPLVLVGAYQPGALVPAAQRLIHSLQRRQQVDILELVPFSPAETAQLAAFLLQQPEPDRTFVNRLYRAAEGNPLFITEFLRTAPEPLSAPTFDVIPRTFQAAIHRRLEQLSLESQTLLRVAAALGRAFSLAGLARAAKGFTADQLLDALDSWLQKGLVVEAGAGYSFTHEQVRWAVCAQADPLQRDSVASPTTRSAIYA